MSKPDREQLRKQVRWQIFEKLVQDPMALLELAARLGAVEEALVEGGLVDKEFLVRWRKRYMRINTKLFRKRAAKLAKEAEADGVLDAVEFSLEANEINDKLKGKEGKE
jgi:hypothetical protein